MPRLLLMLAPPRSFSSLVSTMIGQHPEIYGFPELHVLVRRSMHRVLQWERNRGKWLGPPGLLRALSELNWGEQTDERILEASTWLEDRRNWDTIDMMKTMMDLATEKTGRPVCLEKTPTLSLLPASLDRIRRTWPDALYLHVTRHPVHVQRSIEEYAQNLTGKTKEQRELNFKRSKVFWPYAQRNILDFTGTLQPGQYLRIRGEDVLRDAPSVMRQVAQWAGLRSDPEAVEAMLRPEESPYARVGPPLAMGGNDGKFLRSPKFRPGAPKLASLKAHLEGPDGKDMSAAQKAYMLQLSHSLGYE